jgi:ABC-type lipoprotein release transport system permease subunit
MFRLRALPWEYGVRNLMRRPTRTALTLCALAIVVLLVLVIVGFIRGLEVSLAESGDPDVALIYSVGAEDNIENSAIPARIPSLLQASVPGVRQRFGIPYVSPELYLGARIQAGDSKHETLGLVRGVTETAPLVRRQVSLVSGKWPEQNEVIVGRLAPAKLGRSAADLAIGKQIILENRPWKISGVFTAAGSALESEIWCQLSDLQRALKRQDLSLVALSMNNRTALAELDLFCKSRTDLELKGTAEVAYYESLQRHYKPVRMLAWLVVLLVAAAGMFAGLNMMYGAVAGRVREIATLQAVGYRRRAVLLSLVQEGALLAATASLVAAFVALVGLNGLAVRFTMGAFALRIDGPALVIGCCSGLLLGVLGAMPPAVRVLRLPVAESLKAI